MVINTHFKFIFVHIPKAAGTSVMKSLDELRGNERSWLASTKHETLSEFYSNARSRSSLVDGFFTDYFTFGFVRNPWDRMASFYRFLVEKRPKDEIDTVANFKDFLVQANDGVGWIQDLHSMRSQLDYFTLPNGRMQLDFLGHYEFLNEDFLSVMDRLKCTASLRHANRSSNNSSDYRKPFDDSMIEIVGERFSEEIDLFGYVFDQAMPMKRISASFDLIRPED